MAMVSMRQLLDEAAAGGYGVGAFNVNNMEQIQAIMEAARETSSPVIIQASRGARSYTNDRFLYHLDAVHPGVPRLLVSARTGEGVEAWGEWLASRACRDARHVADAHRSRAVHGRSLS